MPLLTRDDVRRHSWFAWACMAALAGVAVWFWAIGSRTTAIGAAAGLAGCLGLILPPRERMEALPWRVRALPRSLDAAPVLATLMSSPGYGLGWFYGDNLYDEAVHVASGVLVGAVFAELLLVDGRRRAAGRLAVAGVAVSLGLGAAWEVFEWAVGLVGSWTDTWTDAVLTGLGAGPAAALAAARRRGRADAAGLRRRARGVPE